MWRAKTSIVTAFNAMRAGGDRRGREEREFQ
jgi:hypothetical protein